MTIIRVIDFETTGTEPPAQVCEVGFCDLDLDAKAVGAWQSWLCAVSEMPPEVRAVHHITLAECQPHSEFSQAQAEAFMDEGAPPLWRHTMLSLKQSSSPRQSR